MGISYPAVQIRPDVMGGGQPPQAPLLSALLQATDTYLRERQNKRQESISSQEMKLHEMAFKLQQQEHDRQMAAQDFALETAKHQQIVAKQQGEALKLYGQYMSPGQAAQMFPLVFQQTPSNPVTGPGPGGTPFAPMQQGAPTMAQGPQYDPQQALALVMSHLSPEAAVGFAPQAEQLQKLMGGGGGKLQFINTHKGVTVGDPNRGIYDPEANGGAGGWGNYLPGGETADEKADKEANRELQRLRIAEAKDALKARQGQAIAKQFASGVGGKIAQAYNTTQRAILNIQEAMDPNTSPSDRQILTSSAIGSFVAAAEPVTPQLRYQMLMWFKGNVRQDFKGKFENMISLLSTGQYPNETYQSLQKHLRDVSAVQKGQLDKMRNRLIKQHPDLDLENWLADPGADLALDQTGVAAPDTGTGMLPLPPRRQP